MNVRLTRGEGSGAVTPSLIAHWRKVKHWPLLGGPVSSSFSFPTHFGQLKPLRFVIWPDDFQLYVFYSKVVSHSSTRGGELEAADCNVRHFLPP